MNSRRTLIRNSAMLIGGLFVSGKLLGQSGGPAGPTVQPGIPNTTPTPNNPAANNMGLYQQNYPSVFNNTNYSSVFNNNVYSGQYSVGYSQGFYNTGYATSFYGTGYSGFYNGQYN